MQVRPAENHLTGFRGVGGGPEGRRGSENAEADKVPRDTDAAIAGNAVASHALVGAGVDGKDAVTIKGDFTVAGVDAVADGGAVYHGIAPVDQLVLPLQDDFHVLGEVEGGEGIALAVFIGRNFIMEFVQGDF